MNNIEQYTIPCTEEQTKKALELGASLVKYTTIPNFAEVIEITTSEYYEIPTAEQMIGWLETLISFIDVIKLEDNTWLYVIYPYNESNKNITVRGFSSRPKATLAAIDAALEYLTNNK